MDPEPQTGPRIDKSQWALALVIVLVGAASTLYDLLKSSGLQQTAVLFIGLPTLLALVLALAPRARSPLGMVMKGITIALLLSGPVLREGFICILMAAPLFYMVGLVVGILANFLERRQRRKDTLLVLTLLLPQSFEGTHPALSFPRSSAAEAQRVVQAAPAAVAARLAAVPRFERPLPAYLRARFPRPTRTFGSGLEVGDVRRIQFDAGGELVFVVVESRDGRVVFRCLQDTSPIAGWLTWERTEVEWHAVEGGTHVTWRLHYERRLDPAWYFGPWEHYAVGLAAGYLADTLTTPAS